uniref:Uncharacterized protein n=1 Tax=Rhizophora mucronata TaxID=61149 RepID=A0A2P2NDM2_RHIMU
MFSKRRSTSMNNDLFYFTLHYQE